ncbi:MAG: FmdB family zinc ribbon protein [bacterium]
MQTVEYECHRCGLRFELVQVDASDPIRRCPKCAGSVRRLDSLCDEMNSGSERSAQGLPIPGRSVPDGFPASRETAGALPSEPCTVAPRGPEEGEK